MRFSINPHLLLILLAITPVGLFAADQRTSSFTDSELEAVFILSRHGVRSPLHSISKMNEETSATWPEWKVPPGWMTPRGRELIVGMGGYYRDRFTSEGLLTGQDAEDVKHAWFHSNVIQRTVQTGHALAEGIFPNTTTTVYHLAEKEKDALFYGAPIDPEMKTAVINGRIGNDTASLMNYLEPQINLIETALGHPGLFERKLSSLSLMASMADSFMLQYCEGMPMSDVAFGRLNKSQLLETYKVLANDFDLMVRTPYLARQRMSNLVGHLAATFGGIAKGKHNPAAFGDADDRLFVIAGHDTTVNSVAGLLRLEWALPGTGRNLCPPGGALVFELRKKSDQHFVRVYFAAETLDQMRNAAKLSLENPPAIAPIFIPGASKPVPHYDASLADFQKVVKGAIDHSLVVPIDDGK